jgi:hypothetical protein
MRLRGGGASAISNRRRLSSFIHEFGPHAVRVGKPEEFKVTILLLILLQICQAIAELLAIALVMQV